MGEIYVVVRYGHRWMSLSSVMFDDLEAARAFALRLGEATVFRLVDVDAEAKEQARQRHPSGRPSQTVTGTTDLDG